MTTAAAAAAADGAPGTWAELPRLVLASASPRRSELLALLGLVFEIIPADVDESVREGEVPAAYVERVACDKAAATTAPGSVVIAADTTVVLDGEILAKPRDADDARAMLTRLAERTHEVLTAVVVATPDRLATRVSSTAVTFGPITPAELDWYVATGEPLDKAGAYGIQGAGGLFVTRIDGSYHNVVGLPLDALRDAVADLDHDLLAWGRSPKSHLP